MLLVLAVAVLCSAPDGGGKYGRWIDDLGHDDPAVREAASCSLRSAGRAAWAELDLAARTHPDLETRSRCHDLLVSIHLRRRLPWRVLDEFPQAVATLQNGPSSERIALIRILARAYEETVDLLLELVQDPDPEVVLTACEYLQERRNTDWTPRLLELYAREECPRANRAYELLTMASGRVSPQELERLFTISGPRGRSRLLQLALNATLPLQVSAGCLRGLLESREAATQHLALSWLRERACPGVLPWVEPLLSDPDPGLVADALSTLRTCGWRPPAGSIQALLGHDDPAVREEAIQACLTFEEHGCVDRLRLLLEDSTMSVRQSAITALARLGGPPALEDMWRVFLRDSGESRETAAEILKRSPEWSMARLRPLLKEEDPDRRLRAYELWSRIESIRVLTPLAADREETVRRWALQEVLRRQEAAGAADVIELFARDASDAIRFDALRTLVRLDHRTYAAGLEGFLASREYSLRFDAAEVLLGLRDDRAMLLARKLVEEPDAPLRRLGYFALADKNDRSAADRAIQELNDPDGRLGGAAAKYLRQLLTGQHDDRLLLRLGEGLEGWNGEALELAFNLVMEYGDPNSAVHVRKLISSGRAPRPDRAVRALADWAGDAGVGELAALLGENVTLNESVYSRLRDVRRRYPESGRKDLEASFARLFASCDRRVRRGAVQAASDLGLPLGGLAQLVNDPEASVRCGAIGAARVLSLANAASVIEGKLDDDDPDVRVAAAQSLAALKPAARGVVERACAGEDCAWARRRIEAALATQPK
jgi:HEAT repeat protein